MNINYYLNNSYYKIISISVFIILYQTNLNFCQNKFKVILDADTGNEVDDLFALTRALIEPSWEVMALNATQWQSSQYALENTLENSHRLNETLLGHLGISILTRRGGNNRMFDWGDKAQHSAATYEIIKQAKLFNKKDKLNIVATGALTNIASAIYIEPSIENNIKLYWLGTSYDFEKEILSITDFNCVMDIQSLYILLNSNVEMHIMPTNIAFNLRFSLKEIEDKIKNKNSLGNFLNDRWKNHFDAMPKERIIWDLALIEAIIHPEWTKELEVLTSKDNGGKNVKIYSYINSDSMKIDFFKTLSIVLQNTQ